MRSWFFPILVGCFILGWASVASGCANGASAEPVQRRSDAGVRLPARLADAGIDKPDAMSGGVPLLDAGMPLVGGADAGSVLRRDAGMPVPPSPAPTDANLVRIRLTPELQAQCALGWRIRLWLNPVPEESSRGGQLERSVLRRDGWSSVTLWCDERSPQWHVWDAADLHALGSGAFAELSMGGTDLRSSVMLCEDPLSPGTGFRPILMWDGTRRDTCPP